MVTHYQIADIYTSSRQNILHHIEGIYKDQELQENRTSKKYLQVQIEGKREVKREINHYNLDMIIAIGYRIQH